MLLNQPTKYGALLPIDSDLPWPSARAYESLPGARRAIVHVYNSASVAQRRVVFRLDRAGIVDIAVRGAEAVREHALRDRGTEWIFQYSPESFTGTELDFAVEICDAVNAVW